MKFWADRSIASLIKRADGAVASLSELVTRSSVDVDQMKWWGQFLDRKSGDDQYGAYGTAAALVLLGISGRDKQDSLISSTVKYLEAADKPDEHLDDHDRGLTTKLAYLAWAELTLSLTCTSSFAERLKSSQNDDGGWGHYYYSHDEKDEVSDRLTTAFALLALSSDGWRSSNGARKAVKWLLDALRSPETTANENALALLALNSYTDAIVRLKRKDELKSTVESVRAQVHEAKFIQKPPVHFPVKSKGKTFNRYVFFLPGVLSGYSLVTYLGEEKGSGSELPGLTRRLLAEVENPRIRLGGENRTSTVDVLWIWLYLREFSAWAKSPKSRIEPRALSYFVRTRQRKNLASLGLVASGLGATYGSFQPNWNLLAKGSLTFGASVIASVLAGAVQIYGRE